MSKPILEIVQEKYAAAATSKLSNTNDAVREVAAAFGYTEADLASIPAEANLGLSCGNPTALAELKPGEVVVDLGSGGGLDVFLAAQRVGPQGKAIGIDMTAEMIDRARTGAEKLGYTNVEFYQATIDQIPLPLASVDCVISNCVINLAPDKAAVFREIFRVLKPGGRVAISDIALRRDLPPVLAQSVAAYVGCIAGALPMEEYTRLLREAGFVDIQLTDMHHDLNAYSKIEGQAGCCSPNMGTSCCGPETEVEAVHLGLSRIVQEFDINEFAASVSITARKPGGR